MKRKLMSAMFVIGIVGLILSGASTVNAKPKSATDTSSLVANVRLWYGQNYYTGEFVVYAEQYAGMVETEYGSYPSFEPCAPEVCGTLVINNGKKPTITLSKLSTETVVSGSKSYGTVDYSQYHYYQWDGSAIPLSRNFKDTGKPVSVPLQYASVNLYLEGAPVPPTGSCCK